KPDGPDADWAHLPDPVADAIGGLVNRIAELEQIVVEQTGRKPGGAEVRPLKRRGGPDSAGG
ncbi:MAG: serine O-acetyltransferase, partial [Thermoleophilaceae bacterium]